MATNSPRSGSYASSSSQIVDAGLRSYMLSVYNLMALAIALTGLVAFFVASSQPLLIAVATGPLKWIVFIGILGLGFMAPRLILGGSSSTAQICFWGYAALWGLLIAPLVFAYTGASVARAFFVTSSVFAAMSIYGYTTKRDLSVFGKFFFMATVGILVALLVNTFLVKNSGFDLLLSIGVVLVFSGMTAYETQAIKDSYFSGDDAASQKSKAIFGAFILYGSFVTLFIWILHLLGTLRGE